MLGIIVQWLSQSVLLENLDLLNDRLELGRVLPLLMPVSTNSFLRSSSNGLQHELGRVGISGNLGTVSLEVLNEDRTVFTDVAKVDGLATTLNGQQVSEVEEEGGRCKVQGARCRVRVQNGW